MPREVKDNGTGMQKEARGFGITGKFTYLCKKENGGIMAIANSILGKIRGSISNLTFYVRKGEQQVIRKKPSERQTSSERQQRQETAFAEAMEQSYTFIDAIEVGFPEGVKGYPAGIQGFVKANAGKACTGERIDPSAKFKRQKKAPRAFRGRTDYALVQVAAGPLEVPRAEAVLDEKAGTVVFSWEGIALEAYGRYRDDRLYGAVACPDLRDCYVEELGRRGEDGEHAVRLVGRKKGMAVWAYVFATDAEGKTASGSACVLDGTMKDEQLKGKD